MVTSEHDQKDTRKTQLDGLRFFAFLGVFLCHAGDHKLFPRFSYGCCGVDLFFALSGFLITRMLLLNCGGPISTVLKTFYIRRTLRIFPVYYAYVVILCFFNQISDPLACFLYVFNWVVVLVHKIEYSYFWTLSVEEQYYLIFPFLLLSTPPKWRLTLLITLVWIFQFSETLLWGVPYFYMITFTKTPLMWGSLAGFLDVQYAEKKLNGAAIFAAGLISMAISYCIQMHLIAYSYAIPSYAITEPLRTLGCALVVWGLWRTENKYLLAPFKFAPIAYLGQISYGLYLFHGGSIAFRYWLIRKVPAASQIEAVPFLLFLTIAQAMLSWHFFEKPINDLKDGFKFGGQEKPQSAPQPDRVKGSD